MDLSTKTKKKLSEEILRNSIKSF